LSFKCREKFPEKISTDPQKVYLSTQVNVLCYCPPLQTHRHTHTHTHTQASVYSASEQNLKLLPELHIRFKSHNATLQTLPE